VEELARRAELSVDTIRYYQKLRLLAPPRREGRVAWYGTEHVDRLARIRNLQRDGYSLAVIRRLLDGEIAPADAPLAAAVAGEQQHGALLTLGELAERVGVPAALLEAVGREGLLVPQRRDGVTGYTDADADLVRAGLELVGAGLPLADLLGLARRHHAAALAVAEEAVAMFDEHVRRPLRASALSDDEQARRLVDAFRTLLPTATTLVAHHFRAVLLETAQAHLETVGDDSELAIARDEPDWGAS
jgi:DNA-binding transcriptional MerR regulator